MKAKPAPPERVRSCQTLGVAKNHLCKSEPQSRLQDVEVNTPYTNALINSTLASVTWKNVFLWLA